jgi:hypothetical protein
MSAPMCAAISAKERVLPFITIRGRLGFAVPVQVSALSAGKQTRLKTEEPAIFTQLPR